MSAKKKQKKRDWGWAEEGYDFVRKPKGDSVVVPSAVADFPKWKQIQPYRRCFGEPCEARTNSVLTGMNCDQVHWTSIWRLRDCSFDCDAMVCKACAAAGSQRADRDGEDRAEVWELCFDDFSNDKRDLNNAQAFFKQQMVECQKLWNAQWEAEARLITHNAKRERQIEFAKLYLAEGLRISAEAQAAGVIGAGKIPAALMRRWLNDEEEQSALEPGQIELFTAADLGQWLGNHVTQQVWPIDDANLARAAAQELQALVQSAGWLTDYASILTRSGHFPLGVKHVKGSPDYQLFMNTVRPERTGFARKSAVFLSLSNSPNLRSLVTSIVDPADRKYKPPMGSARILFYWGDAHIRWHQDGSSTGFDTPLRNQLMICFPDQPLNACRSEVLFKNRADRRKPDEFDQPIQPNLATKVFIRDPAEVTHMTVDCLASGSCKHLNAQHSRNPIWHCARSTGAWMLLVWPSKPWLEDNE